MTKHPPPSDASWFERPRNVRNMISVYVLLCAGLALADWFDTKPHAEFEIETSFAFHAWFGFVAFVVIVFMGRLLRLIVSRPEDYYHDGNR